MKNKFIGLFIVLGLSVANGETIDVKLDTLIKEVLKRNSNMVYDRMQNKVLDSQVEYEKNIFIPQVYSSFTHQKTNVPNNTEQSLSRGYLETYKETTNDMELGLKGLLPTGGTWKSAFKNNAKRSSLIEQYKDYEIEYTNNFELTLVQPVLKGAGFDVTLSRYHLANADKNIFDKKYEKEMMDLIGSVIQTYWRFYGIKELQKSYEDSIELNKQSIYLLEKKAQSGDVAQSEVLEAKSALFLKEGELKKVNSDLADVKSIVFNLLNVPQDANSDIEFNLLDTPNTQKVEELTSVDVYYKKALENWPDYQMAQEKLRKEDLNIKFTQNNVKPQFDLSASLSNSLLDSHRNYDYDEDRFVTWRVGFEFSMPILDTQSKSAINMAKVKRNQVSVEIDTLRKRLYNAIASKLVSYNNAKEQVNFYTQGLGIKEELLKNMRVGFELGNSNIRDVINQEDDVIEYKRKLYSSFIDWKLSQAALDKATGDLATKYINIDEIKKYTQENHEDRLSADSFGSL